MNDFEKRIKTIERELTNLKTSSEYTSIKSANFTSGFNATIGTYRITFADNSDIMSMVYCSNSNGVWGSGLVFGRTPSGNTQIVEVGYSEYTISGSDTETVPIVVISNSPVQSIQKIS